MEYNLAAFRGGGQKYGKQLWEIHISLLIWSWATTDCNTSCILLGIDFWIDSSGILYHSSSSCLRDDGGNLLLTLLSKTDQWFDDNKVEWLLGQRRCWSASSCSSNQDWTTSGCVWVYHCLEKLHHC
jgi:hypothetical protein